MSEPSIYHNGHEYEDEGEYPCPLPGYEHALIVVTTMSKPAYWQDGHIYVLVKNTPVHNNLDWVSRLDKGEKWYST